jgi:Na+-driven multidrug efflux pump
VVRLLPDPALSRVVVRLAAPVMLGMLTQTALNLVDTIMVGRLPANYSIAGQGAIGYSLILLWALGGFLSAIQVGTQAITSRRFGEGHPKRSGQALTNSLLIALTCGTLFSLSAWAAIDFIFPLFDSNPRVVELGKDYAGWRMLGIVAMVGTASYKAFFDGIGCTHVHMVAAIVMNIVNLLLNWGLIFGAGPFPQLYVTGAGIGSMISTWVGLFVIMGWSFLPRFRSSFLYYRISNFDLSVLWNIVRVSVPGGLATVFVMSGFALFIKIVGMLDGRTSVEGILAISAIYTPDVFAGMQLLSDSTLLSDPMVHAWSQRPPYFTSATKIIMDTMSVSFMSMIALGTATATLVGQRLGAGEPEMASRYGWTSVHLGCIGMAVFALAGIAAPDTFIAIFNPNPDVIEAGRISLQVMAGCSIFIVGGVVLAQALFGAGYSRYVMWVEALLHAVFLVPLSYIAAMVFDLGIVGIWCSAGLYIFLLAVAMAWKFHEGAWKNTVL